MAISYRAAQTLIKRGNEPALHTALDTGLDANLANKNGWTLLMLAALEGSVTLGKLLLGKGAAIDARNQHDESALSLAAQKGHIEFLQLLMDRGADVNCRPHGTSLPLWLTNSPGLSKATLGKVLSMLNTPKST